MANDTEAQTVTIKGRLSYASFTPEEAFALSQKGKYPDKDVSESKPSFNVLLEQPQLDKLLAHVKDNFMPWAVARNAAGEKKNQLTAADSKKLMKDVENFADATLNVGIKEVPEKTKPLAPECVASIKVTGQKNTAIVKKARVNGEDELAANDGSIVSFPTILPIEDTVHDLYPGAMVAVTLNLWSYYNDPKRPGLGISGTTVVFIADAERFGGGVAVDEEAIFSDD